MIYQRFLCLFLLCFVLRSAVVNAQESNVAPEGFQTLFNGKDLSGWHGMGHFSPIELAAMSEADRKSKRDTDMQDVAKHWTVENGELVNDGAGVYLTTDEDYQDFELWIDYKTVAKADSGVYLRANPQVQIWDSTEAGGKWDIGADKGSGGLWNNSPGAPGKDPSVLADKPFGEWNRLRIQQVGARTSVWLNGKQVVDHAIMENFWNREQPHFRSGPIQLQTHGGEIRWRNVFLKEIGTDEANEILRQRNNNGFASVFNGKDFTGWEGPTNNYVVNEGILKCKPGSGGTIFTAKEYGDFVARVEFRVPDAGNNGLAIRYPGKGDAAYGGMCELQVLGENYPQKLDPRQYHGSAYGMAAATRGYLRPSGEWNFQEVTVQGSKIKVELNGTVILDTDLAPITDFMADSPHPGKDRKRGHFGFAGHNDPVEFRNVAIREIEKKVSQVESAELGTTVNVHRVGNIYLAGQPAADDVDEMKAAGITRVLDLRDKRELKWDEADVMQQAGFDYKKLAFSAPSTLTDDVFQQAREAFRTATDDDKLICHCGGASRVGAVWLAYRVLDEGVDWETALQEANEVGLRAPALVKRAKQYVESESKE